MLSFFIRKEKTILKSLILKTNGPFLTEYPTTMKIQPFPQEEPKRQGTVAYRASKEIDHVLHHEGSAYYKPWQFRNHLPMAVTLKTTYDEIFLLAKEKAFIRPSFSANGDEVKIPALFAKVSGVSTSRKEYWDKMHRLTSQPNCVVVKKFPYMQETKANNQYHYQHALGKDGRLVPEKMMQGNWWQYGQLHDGATKRTRSGYFKDLRQFENEGSTGGNAGTSLPLSVYTGNFYTGRIDQSFADV